MGAEMLGWFDPTTGGRRFEPGLEPTLATPTHWRSLRLFLLYRILLSLALIFFFYSATGPDFLGRHAPGLFGLTATLYGGLTLISALFWYWGSPDSEHQAYLFLFTDIVAFTLMMHASGGIESGLGMLIAISITGGALIMGGRSALLFAAIAALAVIAEQIYAGLSGVFDARFPQAGFLGAVFFATALLTWVLSSRLRATENLAHERQQKLGSMARLNEYIIQHMQTGVLAVDIDNRIILMNDPAWYLLGMPEARVDNPLKAASPELDSLLTSWRSSHQCDCRPFRIHPNGAEIKPHITPMGRGALGDVLLFLEDNSKIQREAQQMKLASLGRLTASIAHEIRNPLGAISHASQLFDESPDLSPADKRLTDIIKANSLRVNKVVENVLKLSRRKPGRSTNILLADWVDRLINELIKTHGFDASMLYSQIEPLDTSVDADAEQLRQIVTNLCNNAKQHAAQQTGVLIQVVGGRVAEFNYPILDIIDNGPGIPPKVAKQIFEPFYTTRNDGTGLGLYIAKELAEANQIRLEYIPGPTGGSCFRLHFYRPTSEITLA
jgi:two-component system sensor histidine kinase PilS (NtrC family)